MERFENPEKQQTFTPEEFLKELDRNWWESSARKIKLLEKHLGMNQEEMFEFLPHDLQKQYQNLHSPEIVDEENLFHLKRFKGKKGQQYKLQCSNSVYKDHTKLDKKSHNALKEVVFSLSQEPTGSALPHAYKVKPMSKSGGIQLKKGLTGQSNFGNEYNPKIFQVRHKTNNTEYRIVWEIHKKIKLVEVMFVGNRNKLERIWGG